MPQSTPRRSNLVFTTIFISAIALLLVLVISIWRDGQEVTQWEPAYQQISEPANSRTSGRLSTSPLTRSSSRSSTDRLFKPAPDLEPGRTRSHGE